MSRVSAQLRCARALAEAVRTFVMEAGYRAEDVLLIENFHQSGRPAVCAEIGGLSFFPFRDSISVEWDEHRFELPWRTHDGCHVENQNAFTAVIYKET